MTHAQSILLLFLCAACISTAFSCSCPPGVPLSDKVRDAQNVFRGTIMSKQELEQYVFYLVRVHDSCRQNGVPMPGPESDHHVTVRTSRTNSCGLTHLEKGEMFTFLTDQNNEIEQCSWEGKSSWNEVKRICEAQNDDPEDDDEGDDDEPEQFVSFGSSTLGRHPRPVGHHYCPVLKRVTHHICALCRHLRHHRHHRRRRHHRRHNRRHHRRHHPRREDNDEYPTQVLVDPIPEETPVHVGCEKIYAPVCGNNGVTYANDCEARNAGITIMRRGECSQPVPREPLIFVKPADNIAQNE